MIYKLYQINSTMITNALHGVHLRNRFDEFAKKQSFSLEHNKHTIVQVEL